MSWIITGTEKAERDPYLYANTVLLLHGDGANGSTNIIDSSKTIGSPKTITAFGNARISTAQSKFGGSSIVFDGAGDRLTIPSDFGFSFGTDDFTVEGWFNESARATFSSALEIGNHLGTNGIIFLTNGGGNAGGFAGMYSGEFITQVAVGSVGQFNHIAWVRQAGQFRTFVNGVSSPAVALTKNLTDISTITIGSRSAGGVDYDINGYIDELRITKGVARYTSNFTPPTAPFPDF